jgi:hypothetical protein
MANPNDDDFTGFDPAKSVEEAQNSDMLSSVLPSMNTQEGSPPSTFTESELQELQAALPNMNIRPRGLQKEEFEERKPPSSKIMDICAAWEAPEPTPIASTAGPQEPPSLDWHGAPTFTNPAVQLPRISTAGPCRTFTGPTNAQCPGYLQCNLWC